MIVSRQRARSLERLRWKPEPEPEPGIEHIEQTSKGRLSSGGVIRGRLSQAGD